MHNFYGLLWNGRYQMLAFGADQHIAGFRKVKGPWISLKGRKAVTHARHEEIPPPRQPGLRSATSMKSLGILRYFDILRN